MPREPQDALGAGMARGQARRLVVKKDGSQALRLLRQLPLQLLLQLLLLQSLPLQLLSPHPHRASVASTCFRARFAAQRSLKNRRLAAVCLCLAEPCLTSSLRTEGQLRFPRLGLSAGLSSLGM